MWDTAKEWICTKHTPLFEIVHSTLHFLIFISNTPHHIKCLLCPCKNRTHPSALSLSPLPPRRAMAFTSVLAPSLPRPPGRGCPATTRLPRRGASAPPRRGRLAASAPLAAPPRPPLLATPPRLPLLASGGSSTGNPPVPWLRARARSARQAARRPPRRGPPPPPPLLELAPSRPEGEGRRGAVAAATSWSSSRAGPRRDELQPKQGRRRGGEPARRPRPPVCSVHTACRPRPRRRRCHGRRDRRWRDEGRRRERGRHGGSGGGRAPSPPRHGRRGRGRRRRGAECRSRGGLRRPPPQAAGAHGLRPLRARRRSSRSAAAPRVRRRGSRSAARRGGRHGPARKGGGAAEEGERVTRTARARLVEGKRKGERERADGWARFLQGQRRLFMWCGVLETKIKKWSVLCTISKSGVCLVQIHSLAVSHTQISHVVTSYF